MSLTGFCLSFTHMHLSGRVTVIEQSWGLGLRVQYDDTNRVRADSGLPHVSLFGAQVRNLHSQSRRQRLHITCQPEGKDEKKN